MKIETTQVSEDVQVKVTAYVESKYPNYKGKALIVKENGSMFYVYKHQDGGPLILGKSILG